MEKSYSSKLKYKNYHNKNTYTGGELNRLNGKYGISAPENSVPVMRLIREHKPKTRTELYELINHHHLSNCKCGIISKGTVEDFGKNLYKAQKTEWKEAKYSIKECIQWEYDLFVSQSLKGNDLEKKAIQFLNNQIKNFEFSEANGYLDEEIRLDIKIMKNSKIVGGIQVKPDSYFHVRDSVKKRNKDSNESFGKPVYYLYYDKNEHFKNMTYLIDKIIIN